MTLEEEIINKAGNAMAREIDREVLWGMMEDMGWTRVMLTRLTDNNHAIDIRNWLALNTKKSYESNGRDFIFEDAKDANWFVLRWGSA
jgi:hypothetical protein